MKILCSTQHTALWALGQVCKVHELNDEVIDNVPDFFMQKELCLPVLVKFSAFQSVNLSLLTGAHPAALLACCHVTLAFQKKK